MTVLVNRAAHVLSLTTSNSTVWSPSTGLYVYPAAAIQMKVSSTHADDVTSTGIGVRRVIVYGVDAANLAIQETVTMNGLTEQLTTASFLRVNRVKSLTSGSNMINSGDINVGTGTVTAGVPATLYAQAPAGYGQSFMAMYSVPASVTGYVDSLWSTGAAGETIGCQLVKVGAFGNVRVLHEWEQFEAPYQHIFRNPFPIVALNDLEIRAKSTTSPAKFSCGFDMYHTGTAT
jgi:hypothetical protein